MKNLEKNLPKILFWFILLSGISLRFYYAIKAPYANLHCDSCTIWLMAKHITEGEFPLFFYGQFYLGPTEALMTAFYFLILGINSFTLHLGTVTFASLAIVSAYFLGKEIKGSSFGICMMAYIAIPPVFFFKESVVLLGYHVELVLFGFLMLLLTLKIPKSQKPKKLIYYSLLGIISGIAFWTHYIIAYFFVPIGIYLLIRENLKDFLKYVFLSLVCALLSSLPFWWVVFKTDFLPFQFAGVYPEYKGVIIPNIKVLFFNFQHIFETDSFSGRLGFIKILVFVGYCLSVFYYLSSLVKLKRKAIKLPDILALYSFISIIGLYMMYRIRGGAGGSQYYLTPIIVCVSMLMGYLCCVNYKRLRYTGTTFFALIIVSNFLSIKKEINAGINRSNLMYKKEMKFIDHCLDNGITRIIGHDRQLRTPSFLNREKLIGTGILSSEYLPYKQKIDASTNVAVQNSMDENRDLRPMLDNITRGYKVYGNLIYDIVSHGYKCKFIEPSRWKAWGVGSKPKNDAFDRHINTTWSTKKAMQKGDDFILDLGTVYKICKIRLFNAMHYQNYPRALEVYLSKDGNNWQKTIDVDIVHPIFWSGPRLFYKQTIGRVDLYVEPTMARFIKIVNLMDNNIHPWEINELYVYEFREEQDCSKRVYKEDMEDILNYLNSNDIKTVYADYWPAAYLWKLSKK